MNFMTMLDIQPSATLRRQDVVAMNTNMILSNSGLMKKDLAVTVVNEVALKHFRASKGFPNTL